MAAFFSYRKHVEFSETDMAGIVHFTNFFRWMEAAEAELFDSLGAKLIESADGVLLGWPRVHVHCDYHAPLRFRDKVEVRLEVTAVKRHAVEYLCHFYQLDGETPVHVATGGMTTVFAQSDVQGMTSRELPPALAQALEKLSTQ